MGTTNTIYVTNVGRGEVHGGVDVDKLRHLVNFVGLSDSDKNAQISVIRSMIEKDFDIKINLYKVVQAIDIYLKEFSVNIAKNPKAVSNIAKILDGTQVIANWFNEDTGDNLWKAFECMGTAVEIEPISVNVTRNTPSNNYGILHNYNVDNKIPMLYNADIADNNKKAEHYYDVIYKSVNKFKIDDMTTYINRRIQVSNPYIGVPTSFGKDSTQFNRAKESKKYISDALDNFQALKNLVNAFIRIGDEFGGAELRRKIFMSPNQIYKYLIDYLKHSSFFINYGKKESQYEPNYDIKYLVPEYYMSFSRATNNNFNNFVEENKYFQMIIKAMSSKILVVLGIYDMFEHVQIPNIIDPIRMVLGGDDKNSKLTAIPEAAELYFRLPRLVEFYRKLLNWRGEGGINGKKITMLPEIGGIFSGIIRIIFQKMYTPESGNYSDYDVKNVIAEINYIYNFFKKNHDSDKPLCHHIIHEFIKEINRKIGVIKGDEMKKFWDLQKKISSPANYGEQSDTTLDTNYAILPDETDDIDQSGLAPSDKYFYRQKPDKQKEPIITKDIERQSNIDILNAFRNDFEDIFDTAKKSMSETPIASYSNMIKESEKEMKKHTNPDNRLMVAMRLIQTTKELNIENDKAFMFHETVITGLNALGSIYNMIINFRNIMRNIDPIEIEYLIINSLKTRDFLGNNFLDQRYDPIFKEKKYYILTERSSISERLLHDIGDASVTSNILYRLIQNNVYCTTVIGGNRYRLGNNATGPISTYSEKNIRDDLKTNDILNNGITDPMKELYVRLRCISRYLTNYPLIMKLFIENIFGFANNELISVRIINDSKTPIQFDFGNLVGTVEELITDIKYYINKFRPFMTKEIIEKYEKSSNFGSINWFEDKFIDELFKGKGAGDEDEYETGTLSEISILTNNVFNHLIRNTGVSLHKCMLNPANINNVINSINNNYITQNDSYKLNKYESYGNLFTELIHYDNTSFDINSKTFETLVGNDNTFVDPLPTANSIPSGIKRLLCTSRAINDIAANVPWLSNNGAWNGESDPFINRFAFWSDKGIQDFKSLMFSFNQLLAMYLRSCADNINNKIYVELIGPFANSISSSAVFSPHGYTFPDLTSQIVNYSVGRRGDPVPNKIICTSLAYIMQRMITDVNPKNQNYDYLLNSLTEVPVYMKDRYKNSLLYITKILRTLISKCDLIKDIMQKTKINLTRSSQLLRNNATELNPILYLPEVSGGTTLDPANRVNNQYISKTNIPDTLRIQNKDIEAIQDLTGQLSSADTRERLSEIIGSISEYTFSLISTAESVQRDFSSDVIYFETYNNFINNYKSRYDKNPLMPLSHMLYFVKNLNTVNSWIRTAPNIYCKFHQDDIFTPDKLVGTTEFKLQYGMRQVITNNKINMIYYPSIVESIKKYNETSISTNAIEIDHYEKFMQRVVSIIRYNIDCRNFKSYVQSDSCSFLINNTYSSFSNLKSRDTVYSPSSECQVYSYNNNRKPTNIIFSIESSNQEDEINKIISGFNRMDNKEDITRMTECINNLIDINILPINMNVLMKDIPLVNLYNYDYTFELMAAKLYNKNPKDFKSAQNIHSKIHDTQDAFLTLLYHPYLQLTNQNMWLGSTNALSESYEYISRIMRGDNSLGLNRPKFLSDQIFNKVLLRSIYPSIASYDEGGVNTSIGNWRGQYGYNGSVRSSQPTNDSSILNNRTDRSWLTYPIIDDGNFTIRHREFEPMLFKILENIGRLRFDSTIIRNLFFIVNVLRITRLKLNRELTSSRNVIINSHYAVNPNVTEYGIDPFGTNEIYKSKMMDGSSRFNVMDTM